MIAVEQIGKPSWPRRVRQFLSELFGSRYIAHLERELVQAKVERDRVIAEVRAENRELLNRLLAKSGNAPILPSATSAKSRDSLGPTRWEQLQAKAIADNAKAEAEDAQTKTKPQEN